jgi:hypothetical protein
MNTICIVLNFVNRVNVIDNKITYFILLRLLEAKFTLQIQNQQRHQVNLLIQIVL